MIDDYEKACKEVIEILKILPKEEYNKIPYSEIKYYNNKADKNYKFYFNPLIPVENQNILKTTYTILIHLYRNYIATEEKIKILDDILSLNVLKNK